MDESTRADKRAQLIALQTELSGVAEIGAESAQPVKLDQSSVGRLSRMDAMQAQAMAQATQQRRTKALHAIQAALVRLENDEYGRCFVCDENINPKRLEVDPIATLCIKCAEGEST